MGSRAPDQCVTPEQNRPDDAACAAHCGLFLLPRSYAPRLDGMNTGIGPTVSRRHRQLSTCPPVDRSKGILEVLPAEFFSALCAANALYGTRHQVTTTQRQRILRTPHTSPIAKLVDGPRIQYRAAALPQQNFALNRTHLVAVLAPTLKLAPNGFNVQPSARIFQASRSR